MNKKRIAISVFVLVLSAGLFLGGVVWTITQAINRQSTTK